MGQWRAARRAGARSGHRAFGGAGEPGGARSSPLPPSPAFLGLSPRLPPGPSPALLPSEMLTGLRLDVEEMALTVPNQRRKLEAVLEAVNRSLQAEDQPLKWSVDGMWGLGWGGTWVPVQHRPLVSSASGVGAPWGLPGSLPCKVVHPVEGQEPYTLLRPVGVAAAKPAAV